MENDIFCVFAMHHIHIWIIYGVYLAPYYKTFNILDNLHNSSDKTKQMQRFVGICQQQKSFKFKKSTQNSENTRQLSLAASDNTVGYAIIPLLSINFSKKAAIFSFVPLDGCIPATVTTSSVCIMHSVCAVGVKWHCKYVLLLRPQQWWRWLCSRCAT